tara:strand:- start:756 stop:1340 length:585 start_codon:yes stop_codon:yes gene_type:complete
MKGILLTLIFSALLGYQNRLQTTIILINGEANLVVLDDLAFIVEVLQPVPYYFNSGLSHEEIVKGLIEQKESNNKNFYAKNEDRFVPLAEVDVLDNAEFIRFLPSKALLNRVAVSRIRHIAEDYQSGGIEEINLTIIYKNTSVSELLTDNRLNSVRDLLIAFGVDHVAIKMQKKMRNQYDNNPFVRVAYKKKVR